MLLAWTGMACGLTLPHAMLSVHGRMPAVLPAKRSAGGLARPRMPPAAQARQKEQQLFRHRFLVCNDGMVIRLPLNGIKVLRNLVKRHEASGIVHTQVEAFRPRHKLRWSADASRMMTLGNAGGSSLESEVLSLEVLARSFGAQVQSSTVLECVHAHASPSPACKRIYLLLQQLALTSLL